MPIVLLSYHILPLQYLGIGKDLSAAHESFNVRQRARVQPDNSLPAVVSGKMLCANCQAKQQTVPSAEPSEKSLSSPLIYLA